MYIGAALLCQVYRPFFLLPSAHVPPLPDSEDSSGIRGFSSNDENDDAEAGETAGEEESRGHSPSPSDTTVADHPKVTRSAARKRRASSLTGDSKYV